MRWYNQTHRHSAIRYVTPAQRHDGEDKNLLASRAQVYAAAKARNPERWTGRTRNWQPVGSVWLNPEKEPANVFENQLEVAYTGATTMLTNTVP